MTHIVHAVIIYMQIVLVESLPEDFNSCIGDLRSPEVSLEVWQLEKQGRGEKERIGRREGGREGGRERENYSK